jgi:hypothetical protein
MDGKREVAHAVSRKISARKGALETPVRILTTCQLRSPGRRTIDRAKFDGGWRETDIYPHLDTTDRRIDAFDTAARHTFRDVFGKIRLTFQILSARPSCHCGAVCSAAR